MMSIVHLVPRLPPPVCGVGDYSLRLGAQLEAGHGIRSHFMTADDVKRATGSGGGVDAAAQNLEACLKAHHCAGQPMTLLLEYSGYGYAKRGAPVWLARAVKKLRLQVPSLRVVSMFHELFATGAPTSSAFWTSLIQRWVAATVAKSSDEVVTNRQPSAQWLSRHTRQRGPVHVRPVFSNFGEPQEVGPPDQRLPQLLAFGRGGGYSAQVWSDLASSMTALKVGKLVMVSHPVPIPDAFRSRFSVEILGELDAGAMSQVLSASRFGLLDYNPDFLGKSGILAAYAAHGVLPLFSLGAGDLPDGLRQSVHYLNMQGVQSDGATADLCQEIQQSLGSWYAPHAVKPTAEMYSRLIDRSV